MKEEDVIAFYRQPWVMVRERRGNRQRSPRGAGPSRACSPVRPREAFLPLEEAVRKMTSLRPAAWD